ncbi:DUF3604 domain-containing protein, partial [bacterium]|nr:DUF3604 domain-containing protein [bacterium]
MNERAAASSAMTMTQPTGMLAVIPSRLGVGELFELRVKLLCAPYPVPCRGGYRDPKPRPGGPFNLNVQRQIQYQDNVPPEWTGRLRLDGGPALDGPAEVVFDGTHQGVFPGDARPIRRVGGWRWTAPGIHFLRLIDEASGLEAWANPVRVTAEPPAQRLYWGDPHWQTFFSDGIRIPEELYAFARNEGFLDFGAVSDHMEGVTDRQWAYFQAVTNDCNEPGRFVTLQGQEWTHHDPAGNAPGHRNLYYRGDGGPVIRSNDPATDTLDKLWARLDELTDQGYAVLAIPHHPANVVMGVKWELGWNPRYETAVEMYSVWGNSEKPESAGNPIPIRSCRGEMAGRHVLDALRRGYRLGFLGGGDIHDGRPGDDLHDVAYPPRGYPIPHQGLTAALAPALTREAIF